MIALNQNADVMAEHFRQHLGHPKAGTPLKLHDELVADADRFDFSQSRRLTYEAALHRDGAPVNDVDGNVYSQEVSREANDDDPGPVATFDLSRIPAGLRSGELTVRVRLCPYVDSAPSTERCGDYGPDGGASIDGLPPAPRAFEVEDTGEDEVKLAWNAVADTSGEYGFEYREQGDATWTSVLDTIISTAARITALVYDLECNTGYEFVVRARGDGVTYDGDAWGFWSDVVSATTAACTSGSASGQLGASGVDGGHEETVLLSWPAASYGDHYLVDIPAVDYRATVTVGRTEHRIPTSLLEGLRGDQTVWVWACFNTSPGVCGLHHELSLRPPVLRPVPAPTGLTATTLGADGVSLRWETVRGAGRYRVEHYTSTIGEWIVEDESVSVAPWTVKGLTCQTLHHFRVTAYGDGVTYRAGWGKPSEAASATTGACNSPPGLGPRSNSIVAGNEAGIFAIDARATTVTTVAAPPRPRDGPVVHADADGHLHSRTGAPRMACAARSCDHRLSDRELYTCVHQNA